MERLASLEQKVRDLYGAKNPGRADWADWMVDNHVFIVAANAKAIALNHGANPELAAAAGMLHDIADAVMKRNDPSHEGESERIARGLLAETGFTESEVAIVVDDAIKYHGCHGQVPQTLEGKALASGDAAAHLGTHFYDYAIEQRGLEHSADEVRAWVSSKIERDFNKKIFFEDVRESVAPGYARIKEKLESLA